MAVQVISIPTEVVSHSLPFPFPILCFIPIPMEFPWNSRGIPMGFPVPLGIPSHAHLYCAVPIPETSCRTETKRRKLDHSIVVAATSQWRRLHLWFLLFGCHVIDKV